MTKAEITAELRTFKKQLRHIEREQSRLFKAALTRAEFVQLLRDYVAGHRRALADGPSSTVCESRRHDV